MDKDKEKEAYGKYLQENNVKIVHCLVELKGQRDELMFLVEKLREEKKKLEMEMERLTYKLCLVNKSTDQRMRAKQNYDATIAEIEEKYDKLKLNSGDLVKMLGKDCEYLDSMLNKKTSTEDMEQCEISTVTVIEAKDEECECLPNKDYKCIREKMASKMVQAAPETELPVKLEKETNEVTQTESNFSKANLEKGAQTIVTGEPDFPVEGSDSFMEEQKSKLNRTATEYKETSLHVSL